MVELYVTFLENYASTWKLNNPVYSFKMSDTGTASWALALDQTDITGAPIGRDQFAPKRSDYILRGSSDGGASFFDIQGGIVSAAKLKMGDGLVSFEGKDYSWYLDQPFPFDYTIDPFSITDVGAVTNGTPTNGWMTSEFAYVWVLQTQQKVLEDLIFAVNSIGDTGIFFQNIFNGSGWAEVLTYLILHGDQTTMLGHMQALAALSAPYGFDFYVDTYQQIHYFSPRKQLPISAPSPVAIFTRDNEVETLEWVNNGPLATRSVALESFTGDTLWAESHYNADIAQFRTWLKFTEVGAAYYQYLQVQKAAASVGYFERFPQKDLKIRMRPEDFRSDDPTMGYKNQLGNAILYASQDLFYPYHEIAAYFWIVGQDYGTDNNRNAYVDFTLQQIYVA